MGFAYAKHADAISVQRVFEEAFNQGIIFFHITNGRIVEERTLIDQMGILQRLGIIPPLT
jgi:predicted ester cyclase